MPSDPWADTVARVQHLERLGFDHVWVYDHLSWRRYHDRPWHGIYPWLAGVAAITTRIRIGTMVANPNIRHPLVLARDAMTIDNISEGRFVLGVGTGGKGTDATILGQEPLSAGERVSRLDEYLEVVDGFLSGTVTSHRGNWYQVSAAHMLPGCVQRPRVPLAVAAGGRRALDIAARWGDAWITYGDTGGKDLSATGTEAIVRQQVEALKQSAHDAGRDPDGIDKIYLVGNTEEDPLQSLEAFTDFVGRYRDIGFTDVVFHHPRPDDEIWNHDSRIVDQIAERFLTPVQ